MSNDGLPCALMIVAYGEAWDGRWKTGNPVGKEYPSHRHRRPEYPSFPENRQDPCARGESHTETNVSTCYMLSDAMKTKNIRNYVGR